MHFPESFPIKKQLCYNMQEIMLKKNLLTSVLSTTLIGSGVGPTFANADVNIENRMDANMDIQALAQSHQGRSIVGDWSGALDTGIMKVALVLHIHQDERGVLSANFDTLAVAPQSMRLHLMAGC